MDERIHESEGIHGRGDGLHLNRLLVPEQLQDGGSPLPARVGEQEQYRRRQQRQPGLRRRRAGIRRKAHEHGQHRRPLLPPPPPRPPRLLPLQAPQPPPRHHANHSTCNFAKINFKYFIIIPTLINKKKRLIPYE